MGTYKRNNARNMKPEIVSKVTGFESKERIYIYLYLKLCL